MFSIDVQEDQITPLLTGMEMTIGDVMETLVRQTSETLTPFLQQNTPIGHYYSFDGSQHEGGQLRDSLNWNVGPYGASLLGAKQGEYVIGGTRPHPITPKVAKFLAFYWPRAGKGVLRKKVNHPGTKANDFREKALQEAFDEMAIQDLTTRIMTEWVVGGAV